MDCDEELLTDSDIDFYFDDCSTDALSVFVGVACDIRGRESSYLHLRLLFVQVLKIVQ